MRLPLGRQALRGALVAVAPLLEREAPLWLYGEAASSRSYAHSRAADGGLLSPEFARSDIVSSGGGMCVVRARRSSAAEEKEARDAAGAAGVAGAGGAALVSLRGSHGGSHGGSELPWAADGAWASHGSLFNAGALDVMTRAFVATLPSPPPRARVLDFCSGSGMIAAALAERTPSCVLHLSDADSLAIDAARLNLPDAEATVSDGWAGLRKLRKKRRAAEAEAGNGEPLRFDWIVSNPPVHRGAADDLTVLTSLVMEAPEWLEPQRGELWIVAQVTVPVGQLLAAHAAFAHVDVFTEGRFAIWRAAALPLAEAARAEMRAGRAALFEPGSEPPPPPKGEAGGGKKGGKRKREKEAGVDSEARGSKKVRKEAQREA